MLAAVCAYFNPCGYPKLLENHQQFLLKLHGCDLFAIEQSLDATFQTGGQFKVYGSANNLMWQKEALINEAVRRLPDRYTKIAWLDGDIAFQNEDWARETSSVLDHYPIAQLFSEVVYSGRDGITPERRTELSFVASQNGKNRRAGGNPNPGLAWACRRDFFEQHGLPATHVLGGGDVMLTHALTGRFNLHASRSMNPIWRRSFLQWAAGVNRSVRHRVGLVPGMITHFYHGERCNRRYLQRWADLAKQGFNPKCDVRVDRQGQLEWSSNKPELHRIVQRYFRHRQDDETNSYTLAETHP